MKLITKATIKTFIQVWVYLGLPALITCILWEQTKCEHVAWIMLIPLMNLDKLACWFEHTEQSIIDAQKD